MRGDTVVTTPTGWSPYTALNVLDQDLDRSELTSLLDNLQTCPQDLITVGDFNIHIDNATDSFAKAFADILSSGNLNQHVNGSTHRSGHTLDLVIACPECRCFTSFRRGSFTSIMHSTSISSIKVT